MIRHMRKRTCKHCKTFFTPDPRNVGRQHSCAKPLCRQASKAASQRRWLRKPANHDSCRGPAHVERVRQWRQHHPGYGRRKASQASDTPEALQDPLPPQPLETQQVEEHLMRPAFQDTFFMQPAVLVGFIAHCTGSSFQEDIAVMARRLQQLGHNILSRSPHDTGGHQHGQTPHLFLHAQKSTQAVQLAGSALGP